MSVFTAFPRRALVASAAALTLAVTPTATATTVTADRPERLAESFQAGEVRKGRVPSAFAPGADWGLTVDTLYMLAATGRRPALVQRMGRVLARNADKYTRVTYGDVTYVSAGATAKVLIAADVVGKPVRDFGGTNYRKRLRSFVVAGGPDAGRLRDRNSDGTDYSSTLTQALGVIAFSRSGRAPQQVVNLLLKQQCPRGYFTLAITPGTSCSRAGSPPNVDATALAVQAMIAAKRQGDARVAPRRIAKAARWLVRVQARNGSFGSDRQITTRNSNSTGLAAVALADTGRDRAALKARRFVKSLQITPRNAGSARRIVGAIAYDRAAFRAARRDGVIDRDQFRRATAQGAFAFAPKPLRTLRAR